MSAKNRTLIGRSASLMGREAVWQVENGIEILSRERWEIVRRRVLFEDIVWVTHHREYGPLYLIGTGAFAFFFLTIAFVIVAAGGFDTWPAALVFVLIALPATIAFVLRLMFRLDVVTVFGKRTKASIRYRLRKQRAAATYAQIASTVRIAQERMRREIAKEEGAERVVVPEESIPRPPIEPTV